MYKKKPWKYGLTVVMILLSVGLLEGCHIDSNTLGAKVEKDTINVATNNSNIISTKLTIPYIGSDTSISTSCTIDILDSWTPFMTNPHLWSCNENSFFLLEVASKKFESFDKFKDDFLEVAGPSWEIKATPDIFSIQDSQFDYVTYAEYENDRIVNFLMLDDNDLVWYIELCYVQNTDNAAAMIDQAKQMIFSFAFTN